MYQIYTVHRQQPPALGSLGFIDPVTAMAAVTSAKALVGKVTNLFGSSLTYGRQSNEFQARWSVPIEYRAQWGHMGEFGGKHSFWWDSSEAQGAGVQERLENTTKQGKTMSDFYVELCQAYGQDGLEEIHKIYTDTASLSPRGYATRGEFASVARDGQLKKYWRAYNDRYGAQASQWSGPVGNAGSSTGAALKSAAASISSGGLPIIAGVVLIGAAFLMKKGRIL